jgi:hypothetical protein
LALFPLPPKFPLPSPPIPPPLPLPRPPLRFLSLLHLAIVVNTAVAYAVDISVTFFS